MPNDSNTIINDNGIYFGISFAKLNNSYKFVS